MVSVLLQKPHIVFSDCFKHFFCGQGLKVVLSVDSYFLLCQQLNRDSLRVAGNEQFPGYFPDFHRAIYNKNLRT